VLYIFLEKLLANKDYRRKPDAKKC
jgi:hypothetical protein